MPNEVPVKTVARRSDRSPSRRSNATATRKAYADVLRAVAIAAVVLLHTASPAVANGALSLGIWDWANAIDASCRWCVPVFVMISGALLLTPTRVESPREFYRKRFGRIGVPLVAWSAFYLWWGQVVRGVSYDFNEVAGLLGKGQPYYHMYFLFVMVGLYLFTPILRSMQKRSHGRTIPLAAAIGLLLAVAWPVINPRLGFARDSVFLLFIPYLGYYLAGAAIARRSGWQRWRIPCACLLLMSILITIAGARWGFLNGHDWAIAYFYDYFSPAVIVMSLSAFTLILSMMENRAIPRDRAAHAVEAVAASTMGIYLIHPFLLDLLQWRGVSLNTPASAYFIPLNAGVIFLAAFCCSQVIAKIPVARRLVG